MVRVFAPSQPHVAANYMLQQAAWRASSGAIARPNASTFRSCSAPEFWHHQESRTTSGRRSSVNLYLLSLLCWRMATDLGVTFDLPLLQAVSDWQRGHSDRARSNQLGQALKKACAHLPIQYRSGHLVCYRRVSLDKQGVMKLLGADSLKEKISSWTFNTEVAKGMKGGVPFPASNDLGVIFQTTPNPQNIIVNIRALYLDADFRDALFQNEKRIKNYDLGAGRYWDGEDEIVLEIDTVTQSNIYSLGGY